jgi:hypothetical protein
VSTVVEKKIVKNLLSSILFVIGRIHGDPPAGMTGVDRLTCAVSAGPDRVAASLSCFCIDAVSA